MERSVTNIRLAGVGGQGIIVASEVLCEALLGSRFDVKKSEVHGMAQRGGTVNSDVRFGERVYSPTIPHGDAHILLAFEQMESLRYLPSLKAGGTVIVNRQRILPGAVSSGKAVYPGGIEETLRARAGRVICIDALSLAREAGSIRSVNVCLLGALSAMLPIEEELWQSVITQRFKNKGLEANLKAFQMGYQAARKD
ncbi:MAG: indolepyruvate oxidoreductase subunit beta [Armatimonadota bacterium]|jgi:indolepyruvate ferredoxin oxidoreductase beta subunit|nr:indolepyruvate oxidoreductase subunit beta [Armatimonadota bacterium]